MNRKQSRRRFLAETAAIGVGAWITGPNPFAGAESANEQVNVACIGVGGKGSSDTDHAGLHANVVALCDIDDKFLDAKAKNFPEAQKYNDFRKMYDEMEKSIDGVVISTPDHTHAVATFAIKMKKHTYTQKPLTWCVHEARLLREAAKQYGVCTQMGNQGTCSDGLRTSVEIIRSGAIGAVKEIHVWTDRCSGYWKQAPDVVARPAASDPVPPHVNWDLWLGPAPERPYVANKGTRGTEKTYHDFAWRGWRHFGTAALGDMGCHNANMSFMALGLDYPTSIVAESSEVNPETYQQWATINFEFPARGNRPALKYTWWEGSRDGKPHRPPAELFLGDRIESNGQLVIGEKGTLFCPHAEPNPAWRLLPKANFEGFKLPERTLARHDNLPDGRPAAPDPNHKKEWIAAIKANKPELALSNFAHAGLLTETILLGNVAIKAGKKIEWDGANMKITNAPELQHLITREYRKGWSLT